MRGLLRLEYVALYEQPSRSETRFSLTFCLHKMPSRSDLRPRRNPTQDRAQHTVAAIFEAAGLLAAEQGEGALTTNRIAERAGVSIGTLYQYFSTREAIVEAMVKHERARVMRELDDLLGRIGAPDLPPEAMLREFVRIYVEAFASTDPARRALVKLAWRSDHLDSAVHSLRQAAECIALHLQRVADPALRPPTPAQAFVLTRALMGTVRAAVLEDSPVLGTREFEAELVRMCWALLVAGPPA